MRQRQIMAFLFFSLAALVAWLLFDSAITGMSVYDFSGTVPGKAMFSSILLFAFILGILVFFGEKRLDEIVEETDKNSVDSAFNSGEGQREIRKAQLKEDFSAGYVNNYRKNDYKSEIKSSPNIYDLSEREQEKNKKMSPKEKSEYRRESVLQSAIEKSGINKK